MIRDRISEHCESRQLSCMWVVAAGKMLCSLNEYSSSSLYSTSCVYERCMQDLFKCSKQLFRRDSDKRWRLD